MPDDVTAAYDPELQEIAAYAAEALGVPVALVSELGAERQTFLAEVGFGRSETALEASFCAHAIREGGLLEVTDAAADPRFAENPLVAGNPHVRFYAGVPVASPDGVRRGALCVLGLEPRRLSEEQRRTLAFLARQVEARLTLRQRVGELEEAKARVEAADAIARRSRELIRLVTDRMPVRVAYVDREYRFRFLNDAYLAQVGLSRERALGHTLAETLGEAMAEQARPNFERAFAGETHTQEFDAHYNSGVRPIRATYVPDRDAQGRVQGAVVQVVDLTEQRAVEAAQKTSETRYHTLFDSLEDGFCVIEMLWDEAGRPVDYRFCEVNAAFERQTGITVDQVAQGLTVRQIAPGHETHWFETYGRVARTGEAIRFENAAEALGRYYEVTAFRLGEEGSSEVGVLFRDIKERHDAERALADERRRLDETLARADTGVFEIDVPTRVLRANRRMAFLYGVPYREEGVPYDAYLAAVFPEDADKARLRVARTLAEGGAYETQYRVRDAEGRERSVLVRGETTLGPDGRPLRISGVVLDVTERVASERALAEERARQDRTLETAGIATFDWDAVRDLVDANPLLSQIFGVPHSPEPQPLARYLAAVHPDDRAAIEAAIGASLATGERYETEYRVTDADGTERWVLARGDATLDESGQPQRLNGVVLDVTERVEAARALAEARGRLDAVLSAAEIGVWDYDAASGRIGGDANLGAMFGLDPATARQAPAETFLARIHPEDRPAVAEAFGRAARDGTAYEVEYRTVVEDRVRYVVARGFAERDAAGHVVRMPGAVLDITSAKEAQAREREALVLLQAIAEGTSEMILSVDCDYRFTSLNEAYRREFLRTFGLAPRLGESVVDLLAHLPEDQANAKAMFDRALAGENVELTAEFGTGEARGAFDLRFYPIRDASGRIVGAAEIARDVTERVRAEAARQESERRLRVALRGGRMGTWDVDLASGTMVCSDTCKANYGRGPEDPFDYPDLPAVIVEEDRALFFRTVETAIAEAGDFEMEYRVLWPDATLHWVQVRGSCVVDATGKVTALSGVSFDVTDRVRATEERERLLAALATERERLQGLFEGAPAAIATLEGEDLRFGYANATYRRLFTGGRDVAGLTLAEVLPESADQGFDDLLRRVMATGEPFAHPETPFVVREPDGPGGKGPGRKVWVDFVYQPIREADGAVSGVAAHIVDVTNQVVARRVVAEREELFRTVFEQAPDDAILVMDRDRTLTAWNPAAERMTGRTAEEAIGQPVDLIFTPEDRAQEAPARETEAAAREGKAPNERWHVRRDGSRFWGSGTMNALHDEAGAVTGFLKIFRDATARHEEVRTLAFLTRLAVTVIDLRDPDEILRAAERLLGEHLGATRVLFAEVTEDGERVLVREEWAPQGPSIVGTHRIADFGPEVEDDFRAGRTHVSRDAARDYAAGAGLEAVEAIRARSGISVPIHKEGRLAGLFVVHHAEPRDWTADEVGLVRQVADRTFAELERARAEAGLRAANEALEARVEQRTEELAKAVAEAESFNYAISHDLRTPLRAIAMTASILQEEASEGLSEDHRELLHRQRAAASRLAQLIDGLLQLSRLSRVALRRQTVDMSYEARAVAHMQPGCAVEVEEGMTAEGDPGLLLSVWQNLIGNACKFSPEGGIVSVGRVGEAFFVRDHGVGFDMRYAPKIFLPFERLVSNEAFPGTGIGLANVKKIVERHGGRVWAESAPGEGSTFWFTLGEG